VHHHVIMPPSLHCWLPGLQRLPHLNNFQLGTWCTERRGEYNRGHLEVDVAEALQLQVPGWSWNLVDAAFESSVEVLRRCVPVRPADDDE
jgi:hypothetical protein